MADPSLLPWHVFAGSVKSSDGQTVAVSFAGEWDDLLRAADADLIVRSVNAHAALVEALRKFTSDGTFTLDDLLHARALLKELDTK